MSWWFLRRTHQYRRSAHPKGITVARTRIFLLAAVIACFVSQSPAAIVNVLEYHLGEPGSFSNLLPVDTVGGRNMTAAFNFSPGLVTNTWNASYSTNATFFGPTSSGAYGADSSGLPADNFGVEVWVRTPDINQLGNDFLVLNGSEVDSLSFRIQNGRWAASYFGRAWVGADPALSNVQAGVANTWTNLAVIRDRGISTFYINGVAQLGETNRAPSYGDPFGIHLAITPGGGSFFTGDLDEVRIFTFVPGVDDPVAALSINAVPEPASLGLVAAGLGGLTWHRCRRRAVA